MTRTPTTIPYPKDMTLQVVSMEIVDREPYENGDRLLAYFDLSLGFCEIAGCHLVLEKKGYQRINIPKGTGRGNGDPVLLWQGPQGPLIKIASGVYRAMGGSHVAEMRMFTEKEAVNGDRS